MRRIVLLSLLFAVFFLCRPHGIDAQISRADSAAVLLDAARAFQVDGRGDVAAAVYRYIGEHFGGTPSADSAYLALQSAPAEYVSGNGRVELMVWSSTFGLWMGVAVPHALGADDPGPYGAGLLLGGPAGFLGGRALHRSRPMSLGQVRAITFGSLWGTWQGLALMRILDLGEKEHCFGDDCYTDGPNSRDNLTAMVIGGVAGVAAGAFLARKPITADVSTTVSFGALWGSWFGVAAGILGGLEGDALLSSALVGGNVGLLATANRAPVWQWSRSRARLISIAGVLGGLGGVGLDLIITPDSEKTATAIPLAGSLLGLGIGIVKTRSREHGGNLGSEMFPEDAILDPGSPLFNLRDGGLHLGVPSPFPTLVPVDDSRGFSFRPALAFNILSSRF